MATRSLAYGSHCVLKLTLSFAVLGIATSVNAGLNDFRWTSAEKSIETLRKRPKWETSESRDENRPDDMANEKSEWQKEIEEISRMEREKLEKYRTENPESSSTAETQMTPIENLDKELGNSEAENTTPSRNDGVDQFQISEEIMSGEEDKGRDFSPRNEMRNGRWVMRKKHEPGAKQLSVESRKSRKPEKAERNASGVPNDLKERTKIFPRENHTPGLGELWGKASIELGNKVKDRSRKIANGRWGMSGENEPPLGVREEIFRRRIMENNDETGAKRISNGIAKFMGEKTQMSREKDIRGETRGRTEAEKFLDDVSGSKNTGGIEDVEIHAGRLKSARQKQGDKKNFIPKSRNEYWMNETPGTGEGTLGNSRRTLGTEGLANSERNGEKFRESNSRPAGARKLIQIIISAYTGDVQNGIELSIDRLIPGSNGVSSVTELHPIVIIGLSKKKKNENYDKSA